MKIWVLGSGTLFPDPHRGSPGYWIECEGEGILMDFGSGTLRTLARLGRAWGSVRYLLASHFHTDHVGELAPLLFALKHGTGGVRTDPLTLVGPPGISAHLEALARAHGDFVLDPGFPLEVVELTPGDQWTPGGGAFLLKSHPTVHTPSSMAYRIEADPGILGYTGDTGPDPALGAFLFGCHLLVAECSHPDGMETDIHLTPASLFDLASMARPDLLVTVHVYPPLLPAAVPGLLRDLGYAGRVLAGRDGLALTLLNGLVTGESPTP